MRQKPPAPITVILNWKASRRERFDDLKRLARTTLASRSQVTRAVRGFVMVS